LKFERYGLGLIKGLVVTSKNLFRHRITVCYPEKRQTPSKRVRGNELVWNKAKCTVCTTCAKTCPQGSIHMVTAVDPENPGKMIVTKFEVDSGYCINCGLCVEACPYKALHMAYAYEQAKYRRQDLVLSNEQLFASPERRVSAYMHPEVEPELPAQTLFVDQKH